MIKIKENKGITLIAVGITVITIGIILTVISFTSRSSISMKNLNNMYSDINILEDKISIYYLDYKKLPITDEILSDEDIDELENEIIKNPNNLKNEENNFEKFSVIDISKLSDTTLKNKGKYIINEKSHSIYYLDGVEVDGKKYYTQPTEYVKVDLKKFQSN